MTTAAAHAASAPPRFTEREPYETGFAAVFARDIAPRLDELERERLAVRRSMALRAALPVLLAVATVATFAWAISGSSPAWAVYLPGVLLLAAVAAGVFAYWPARRFADRSRDVIMGPICGFLGDLAYSRANDGRFDLQRFAACGIVGRFNTAAVEDVFAGRHRDTPFEMAEAVLSQRTGPASDQQEQIVFRGLLLAVAVPQPFSGRVLLSRDLGGLGNKLGAWVTGLSGLSPVRLPHQAFESRYEVYADHPEEAERLLAPGFLDTMVALADAHGKTALRAGFIDGAFLLALPMRRNLFEPGSVFRSVYGCEDSIREILRQVTVAHRLIDYLHGGRPGWLA